MKKIILFSTPTLAIICAGTYMTGVQWYSYLLFSAWIALTIAGLFTQRNPR